MAQRLKRLPPMRETRVRSLGQEDPLEKEMAIHSSIPAWKIPWTEEPSGLQSVHAVAKNLPANARDAGDTGSISGSGRCPGEGNGNPFQYPCLGNPMDTGAWWATVHGVTKASPMTEQLNNDG